MTDQSRRPNPLLANWRQPLLTVIGMSVAVAAVAGVDPQPGPLVLAAVLAMSVSRNKLVQSWRGRAEAIILLPFVGLATAAVGYLFVHLPIVGAAAYVVAMFFSIFLRRFGPFWTRVGSLIALPFITLLITPVAGIQVSALGVVLLSLVVLVIVVALRLLAEVTRFVPKVRIAPAAPTSGATAADTSDSSAPTSAKPTSPATSVATPGATSMPPSSPASAAASAATPNPQRSGTRPVASTRMAIQMAIALTAAFVVGALVFPQHVTWVVLTAFLVCSGNRGRADVLYKSGLRIVGAAIGTIIASAALAELTPLHSVLEGPTLVIVLLAVIGIGLWLREWTYAAWAVVMTLVITLLQGVAIPVASGTGGEQLWMRILAIIVGAACGLAASWFVLPVRSEGVVRKRIAESLAALSEYAVEPGALTDHNLGVTLQKLDEVAKPWNALERVTGWRKTNRKPGQWMQLVHECAGLVRAKPQLSAGARRALGGARRSVREPVAIGPALLALRDQLQAGE